MGGRGFFPRLSAEVLAGQSRPGLDWERSTSAELSRRSLYVYLRRTMPVPVFEAFDYSNTATPLSERPVTTVAPQALLLLHDDFMQQQASALGARLTRGCASSREPRKGRTPSEPGSQPSQTSPENPLTEPDEDRLIRRGFQLTLAREPTNQEVQRARQFLERQRRAFMHLRSRLTFRPEVPTSLAVEYMQKLKPEDFLVGPREGWSYHRGRWSGPYEGIRTVERERGPFALLEGRRFTDGIVEAKLVFHRASESAGLLVRARAEGEELRGYEVLLDPRAQRLAVRRHYAEANTLAETPAHIPTTTRLPVGLEAISPRLRDWIGTTSGD